jgi:hypothetical protein
MLHKANEGVAFFQEFPSPAAGKTASFMLYVFMAMFVALWFINDDGLTVSGRFGTLAPPPDSPEFGVSS